MESANENADGAFDGGQVVDNGSTIARVNYGGSLCHELLRLIKSNNPNVTELEADFSLGHPTLRNDSYPANTIDWKNEELSFSQNSQLDKCTLDISIFNATPKEIENVKAFLKALSRNTSITDIYVDVYDGTKNLVLGDIFSLISPMFQHLK